MYLLWDTRGTLKVVKSYTSQPHWLNWPGLQTIPREASVGRTFFNHWLTSIVKKRYSIYIYTTYTCYLVIFFSFLAVAYLKLQIDFTLRLAPLFEFINVS